jgi:hypothetical protein
MLHATLHRLITEDPTRMKVLQLVRELHLSDCWVAAGFVRGRVWDHLHGRPSSPLPADVDVIWFDVEDTCAQRDAALEATLRAMDDSVNWSVKNQARMHARNGDQPYASATAAMRCWPETATAVAVRLNAAERIDIAAPLGLEDLFSLRVRSTPRFLAEKYPVYLERVRSKNWQRTWPRLDVQMQ